MVCFNISRNFIIGVVAGFSGAFCSGTQIFLLRVIGNQASTLTVVTNLFSVAVLILAIVITATDSWVLPDTADMWLLLIAVAIVYIFAQIGLKYATTIETATLVSIVSNTEVVFTYVWQIVLFHSALRWDSLSGVILILIASSLNALNGQIQKEHFQYIYVRLRRMTGSESYIAEETLPILNKQ